MNEIQKVLFTIFLETKKVCEKLNIKLIACGGTLLGAARHEGFIPWDDDMDFYMFRDDYEKFIKEGPKLIKKEYFIQTHSSEHDWWRPFMRVRKSGTTAIEPPYKNPKVHKGMWIDIFPIDKQPNDIDLLTNDEKLRRRYLKRTMFFYRWRRCNFYGKLKVLYHDWRCLLKDISCEKTYKKLIKVATKYNDTNYQFYGSVFDDKTKTEHCMLFEKILFDEFVELPFESSTVIANKNFDRVLTIQYGDWRVPPPENERRLGSCHFIKYLDTTTDYRDFLSNSDIPKYI